MRCLWFVVLFVDVRCLLSAGWCALCVVCCLLYSVCCLLFVVCCVMSAVGGLLIVKC